MLSKFKQLGLSAEDDWFDFKLRVAGKKRLED